MAIFTAIFSAVAAVSAFIGTLGAIGTFALNMAVGIGLNLLASALAGKPKQQQEGPGFSVQGKLQAGGDVPRSFIWGFGPTAGSLAYAGTWGAFGSTPNAYFTQVIQVSDLPVSGLAEVWVNGEKVTLITGSPDPEKGFPVAEYSTGGFDYLWIKFYDGTQVAADSYLVDKFLSSDRPYAATRVGVGCAYVVATALINDKLFTGFPTFKFALNGVKLYDISKDSTAGGSGTHRWNDRATWGGDGDHFPAVQMYNLLRGITYNGAWLYGLQNLPAARLPNAHWIAQINKCRALIAGPSGNEATYRSGGQIAVNAQIATAVEALNSSCQGRLAEIGGIYKLHLGAPDAPIFSFTDDDIITTSEQSFTPFLGLAATVNGINAKYPNPEEGWNIKVAPPLYRSDFEAQDANRRLMADVSLDLVPYAGQVQRLMNSALEEARRAQRHTHTLPPLAWKVEPGDIVEWTSNRNSYSTKRFRVDGVVDKANLDVMVDITEVDPSDFDPPVYKPTANGPTLLVRPPPQLIVDWSAQPWTLTGDDGSERPAIKLNWDGDQPDVDAVLFQVRLKSSGAIVHDSNTNNIAAGSIIITQSLIRNTEYQARGRYLAISGREMLWSGWLDVKTPNTHISSADLGVGTVRLDHMGADAATLIDKELASITGMVTEAFEREIRDEKIAVEVGGARAEISEVRTAAATADTALAQLIQSLIASVNDTSASALFRMSVVVAPSGVAARIEAQARVAVGANWESAGWVVDVIETSPGSGVYTGIFRVFADKFQVINSTTTLTPFEVDTVLGVIRMLATRIKTFIQSDNYAEDGSGNPTAGWKIDATGTLKAINGIFINATIRGIVDVDGGLEMKTAPIIGGFIQNLPQLTAWVDAGRTLAVNLFILPDRVTMQAFGLQEYPYDPADGYFPAIMETRFNNNVTNNICRLHRDGLFEHGTYSNVNGSWTQVGTKRPFCDIFLDPMNVNNRSKVYGYLTPDLGTSSFALFTRGQAFMPLRVPTGMNYMTVKAWGGGGSGGNSRIGGAGAFVTAKIKVKPLEWLRVVCGQGGFFGAWTPIGFGGSYTQEWFGAGGGLTGVFRTSINQAGALIVAGGGGAAYNLATGRSGNEASFSGGMSSLQGVRAAQYAGLNHGAGGGGYQGGSANAADPASGGAGMIPGRGGSSFVVSSSLGEAPTGVSHIVQAFGTGSAPNAADSDYVARTGAVGNYVDFAVSGTQTTHGGNGFIVIDWSAS